jgi:hypothetical protein
VTDDPRPGSGSGADRGLALSVVATLAFLGLAAAKLRGGLNPTSLYLDDQWVGVAMRRAGPAQLLSLHLPMPLGFTLLTRLASRLVPDPELALQALPVLAYLAAVALFPVLVYRLTRHAWSTALGAAVIACVPLTETYAIRAKHYTLDELVTIGVLLAAAWLVAEPRPRRFVRFVLAAAVGLTLSFASIFLSTAVVLVAGASAWRSTQTSETDKRKIAWTVFVFFAAAAAFYLLYLQDSARPIMQAFWSPYFLRLDGRASAWSFVTGRVSVFFLGAMPRGAALMLGFAPLGCVWLWRSGNRVLLATLLLFYVGVAAASLLWIYPIGTGRTDIFSVPVTALLSCLGVRQVLAWTPAAPMRSALYATAIAALMATRLWSPGAEYPPNDDGAAVSWVTERLAPSDGLVLSPYGALAYSYFAEGPVSITPVDFYGHGFDAVPERKLTFRSFLGRWDLTEADAVGSELARLEDFIQGGPHRIIYLEATGTPRSRALVLDAFARHGYRLSERTTFGSATEAFLLMAPDGSA